MNRTSAASDLTDNLYELLQVSPRASVQVIRAAYHVLARSYHPDVNPGPDAARQMIKINTAYTILNDPIQRAQYDARAVHTARRAAPRRTGEGARRMRSQSRVDLDSRRFLVPALGRVVLVSLVITFVVACLIVLWSALDAPDDGHLQRSSSPNVLPSVSLPGVGGEPFSDSAPHR